MLAADINKSILAEGFKLHTFGETIDGSPQPRAVYYKNSDGKVYRTDATYNDERILSFIGFAIEDGNANDTKLVQTHGIVGGFSGLTVGTEYCLAEAATTDSDLTTGSHSAVTTSNDLGTSGGITYLDGHDFTPTKRVKLTSVTIGMKKTGSPAGNVVVSIYEGTPSTSLSTDSGNMRAVVVGAGTQACSAITGSDADYTITFATPIILEAGINYTLHLKHDTPSNGNYMTLSANSGTGTHYWAVGQGSGNWSNNRAQWYCSMNYVNETLAAGDISSYFYVYRKAIGIAISATELLLYRFRASLGAYISGLAIDTGYVATTDGIVVGALAGNGSSPLRLDCWVNGIMVQSSALYLSGATNIVANLTVPIRAGDHYTFKNASTGGSPSFTGYFVPFY